MAEQQPADYKIFCLVEGETEPFPVNISPNFTVGDLKDAIKVKRQHTCNTFDAAVLKLYRIDLPDDDDLSKNVDEALAGKPPSEKSIRKLGVVFPSGPREDLIQILIQIPQSGEFLRDDQTNQPSANPAPPQISKLMIRP
jgi:crinkler effector protein